MTDHTTQAICFVVPDYPSKNRPVYVFVQQLAEILVDQGFCISIVAPQSLTRALFRRVPVMPKHEIYTTQKGNNYKVYRPYSISFGNGMKPLYSIFYRFNQGNINRCLEQIDPQVLYGHFWESATRVVSYAASHNRPLYVACGESHDLFDKWIGGLSNQQKEHLRRHVTGVICVSSANQRRCIEHHLCDRANSIVLPNCVNTDLFSPQDAKDRKAQLGIRENDFTLVFVGAFTARKGPDRVAAAIKKLKDKHLKVLFIGKNMDGYDYPFDCPGIIYKGTAAHDQLPNLLNCADAFVLPTRNEGCCNAIVEALACGLPVISSNGAFNDDILDQHNSIRINPDDENAIAASIAYLRDHPDKRKTMKEYSINRHHIYSIENRAQKIINFIHTLMR